MEEMKRKARKRLRFLLTVFGVCGVGLIATFLFRDEIIIQTGIVGLRTLATILGVGAAASGLGGAVFGVTTVSRVRDQLAVEAKRERFLQESQKKETARLSVKDKLENAHLRELLEGKISEGWGELAEAIRGVIVQLEQMDDYQDRLSRLLVSNDAQTLSDTEEVLDSVEQYICRNVRKVLNYMEVADPDSAEDVELLRTKLSACNADNKEQLKQTQEFIFALTDFINQQGDNENDVSMLELYKKTILESIQEQ